MNSLDVHFPVVKKGQKGLTLVYLGFGLKNSLLKGQYVISITVKNNIKICFS